MHGTISIKGLECWCRIGVEQQERSKKQRILVDIEIQTGIGKASRTDHLADAIDYGKISRLAKAQAESVGYKLLERLAVQMAGLIKKASKGGKVTVTIKKPGAVKSAEYAAVTVSV